MYTVRPKITGRTILVETNLGLRSHAPQSVARPGWVAQDSFSKGRGYKQFR